MAGNKEYLLYHYDRKGIEIPETPPRLVYYNLGTQENQNCYNVTLHMKNNKGSWNNIYYHKDAVTECDKEPVMLNLFSVAKTP